MNTAKCDVVARLDRATIANDPSYQRRRLWCAITILLAADVFVEAVFAGAMLSGVGWARTAHSVNAALLIASTVAAGLAALSTLRRIPHGSKLGLTLLSLAAAVVLQAALGASSAKGANPLWVHVPLGVALFGFAAQTVANACRLHDD